MQNNIINPDEVRTQLEALANEIEKSDRKAANRLHNLRIAVGRGNNADAWAASNINQLINPEQIIEKYRNQPMTDNLVSLLEWIRNILIFVPLLVSWYGISQAVSKYGDFVGKHRDQITQPFLYLWQTGFGNELPGWQTLGFLAGIDAILLFLLVVVTIAHSTLGELWKQRRFQEAERLRTDLTDTLAGAALCLTTRSWQQPTNFVDAFDQSSRSFKETMDKMLGRIESLAQAQRQDHQTFTDLRKDLSNIMTGVSSAMNGLKASNDVLRKSMSQLSTPLIEISNTLGIVGTSSQELITLYKNQVSGLQAILSTLQQWGTALQNTLGKLDSAVNTGQRLVSNVEKSYTQSEALHAAMTKELAAQTQLTGAMVGSTSDLRTLVSDLATCLNEYKALNKEIYDLAGRVAILAQRLPARP